MFERHHPLAYGAGPFPKQPPHQDATGTGHSTTAGSWVPQKAELGQQSFFAPGGEKFQVSLQKLFRVLRPVAEALKDTEASFTQG